MHCLKVLVICRPNAIFSIVTAKLAFCLLIIVEISAPVERLITRRAGVMGWTVRHTGVGRRKVGRAGVGVRWAVAVAFPIALWRAGRLRRLFVRSNQDCVFSDFNNIGNGYKYFSLAEFKALAPRGGKAFDFAFRQGKGNVA